MLVIKFNRLGCHGGLGDRIVGLIALKLISKLLKRKFYIRWEIQDVKKYINYSKYDFNLLDVSTDDVMKYSYINRQKAPKEYLINTSNAYPNRVNFFHLNQEISQYLYKNKLFLHRNYLEDILHEYSTLYSDILVPTDYLSNKVSSLTSDKPKIVGIQARCGDAYMVNAALKGHKTSTGHDAVGKLEKIKLLCTESLGNDYNIFFTTDNLELLESVYSVFGKSKVIYNNDLIQHLDNRAVEPDISKVFVDNYILSQKTEMLFITGCSNYGRVAALSCGHNNIYDFDTCNKLEKKGLLSKHEQLFS